MRHKRGKRERVRSMVEERPGPFSKKERSRGMNFRRDAPVTLKA